MLHGPNFGIRHIRKDDLPALFALINDLSLRGDYLPFDMVSPANFERRFAEASAGDNDRHRFVIVDPQDVIIGSIMYFKSVPYFSAYELGYGMLSLKHRNTGITTAALRLMCDYLFNNTQVNRLELRLDVRNLASERVAQKAGFQKEGVSRAANFVRGKFVDMAVYALLRQEWASHA